MRKLIAFILILLAATVTIVPVVIIFMDAVMEGEDSFIYKLYKEI